MAAEVGLSAQLFPHLKRLALRVVSYPPASQADDVRGFVPDILNAVGRDPGRLTWFYAGTD